MGIIVSFLFPRHSMDTQLSVSSQASSSSRSSSPKPDYPPSPLSERAPSPPTDRSVPPEKHQVLASPPLESLPYSSHAIGIGILSPQLIIGPLAPITRASLSPLQHKSSPSQQCSNPFDSQTSHPANCSSSALSTAPADDPQSTQSFPASFSGSAGASGLRISIPPPNPTISTFTPSPPLRIPPAIDPLPTSPSAPLDLVRPLHVGVDLALSPADITSPSVDPVLDFTEFDADGLSALEKIYLFSRSPSGFHRVFIAHALPRYLGSDAASDAQYPSREEAEQISPGEAVEYVLPLLNGLAMDDDEAVKEALAAELVPIIWWFITHCRLVEDDFIPPSVSFSPLASPVEPITPPAIPLPAVDHPPPAAEVESVPPTHPTFISVQAFTPILGMLLLSQNGFVGGPARYAVVELLKRVRHADEREYEGSAYVAAATAKLRNAKLGPGLLLNVRAAAEQEIPDALDVGLLGYAERRLFEREIVHQVVIGMGRLDMPDDSASISIDGGESESSAMDLDSPSATYSPTTAVPTPLAGAQQQQDSYFPLFETVSSPIPVANSFFPESSPGEFPVRNQDNFTPPTPMSEVPSLSPLSSTSASTPLSASSVSSSSLDSPASHPRADLPSWDESEQYMSPRPRVEEINVESRTVEKRRPPSPRPALAFPAILPAPHIPAEGINIADDIELRDNVHMEDEWQTPAQQEGGDDIQMQDITGEYGASGEHEDAEGHDSLSEEAAVGRLSSMSLVAAVTASAVDTDDNTLSNFHPRSFYPTGAMGHEMCDAFVAEVERVGRDPVYWVRREATFAVGALAKVVPDEVVVSSLLPLFESLCQDATWHVRHSVLFALPAILSRLGLDERRALALDVMLPLARDESPTVRSAVLEALGEVMHTFTDDLEGPPRALLDLFLGVRDETLAIEQPLPSGRPPGPLASDVSESGSSWSEFSVGVGSDTDIYDDPARPLVCAFNYPAVALTLGRARWPELRELYRTLARDASFKVRRTLAASLGELANIIGWEHARDDLMQVWAASVSAAESEVRLKAVENVDVFLCAIGESERREVVRTLELEFRAGRMKGWREREELAKKLEAFVVIEGLEKATLRRLLMAALEDNVAAVREAAVDVIPAFMKTWRPHPEVLAELCSDIGALALSESFRKRTTYIRCQQVLIVSNQGDVVITDDAFWEALSALVHDPVVDVRIHVARLLGSVSERYYDNPLVLERISAYAQHLEHDTSHDVRAFAHSVLAHTVALPVAGPPEATKSAFMFSRPPPPSPS
ncbi:hypothetical protein SCP_0404060 [Sparassis crispa]|uniref:ARM repeat-containing protein n=1 Tax=Sparassis crispa TaxID=139825 RepID=A0A401GIK0_9APHY|nr:hypothetical protein SCP_0404060 [Sparassis crispa]GBE82030.1 hypothetical protein SCP_0404060 [Sparassis crispa]